MSHRDSFCLRRIACFMMLFNFAWRSSSVQTFTTVVGAFRIPVIPVRKRPMCWSGPPLVASQTRRGSFAVVHSAASSDLPAETHTRYTLNDSVCRPTEEHVLAKTVTKHCRTLDTYLQNKPIASHTQEAFDQVSGILRSVAYAARNIQDKGVVLDSGCGTGTSTLLLGQMYPDHVVIGIDRSLVRLNRNAAFRGGPTEADVESDAVSSSHLLVQTVPDAPNVLLVRAELSDFWRLCLRANWTVSHHYLLYPNPYPKPKRLQSRWYGHPSFPLILQLGGHIQVRSNWEGYLQEFARSIVVADDYLSEREGGNGLSTTKNYAWRYVHAAQQGPMRRHGTERAWTNFEEKYDDCGEPTYVLDLQGT